MVDKTSSRRRRSTPDTKAEAGKLTMSMQRVVVKEVIDDKEVEVDLDVEMFETAPAHVEVSAGLTRNLGDYESLKVHVTMRVPCYKEQIENKAGEIGDIVSERLYKEIDCYLDAIDGVEGVDDEQN